MKSVKEDMGRMECCGVSVPISGFRLRNGDIYITGQTTGPTPGVAGEIAVYGPDGILWVRGGSFRSPPSERGQEVTWNLQFHVAGFGSLTQGEYVTATGERVRFP